MNRIEKIILNILLYLTQKLFMRHGGEVLYNENKIILRSPDDRKVVVPKKHSLTEMAK